MKTSFFKITVLVLVFASLTACTKAKSSWMMNADDKNATFTETSDTLTFDFNPKAEIIFVIDNSWSMNNHITKVSENIDKFVTAFSRNNPLQYNLAVMSVYDTRRFTSDKYKEKWGGTSAEFKLGQFRQVKRAANDFVSDKYFISSTDENLNELLRNTLKVGVQGTDSGGPDVEESFSPIAAAYGLNGFKVEETIKKRQEGFYLGEDSYKIIFIVTDATDASDVSASELYSKLVKRSGGDRSKVLAFGAIIPLKVSNCARDPGNLPYKLEEFFRLTKKVSEPSNVVSLCDSFGDSFAEFGKSIRTRTVSKVIELKKRVPVMTIPSHDANDVCLSAKADANQTYDRLHVCYGDQEIPFETSDDIIGFKYSPANNSVRINPNFEFDVQPNAKLRLLYTAVNARLQKNGKVTRYGE